jgi:hypothetical protein
MRDRIIPEARTALAHRPDKYDWIHACRQMHPCSSDLFSDFADEKGELC